MEGENGTGENTSQSRYQVLAEKTLAARPESIGDFIAFASEQARLSGFSDDRITEIEKVLTDAVRNIIEFTFGEAAGEITLSCNIDKFGKFVLAVVDSGKPFNMLLEDDPFIGALSGETDARRPTTKAMKRFSSNIEYKRLENRNHLIITLARDMKRGKE